MREFLSWIRRRFLLPVIELQEASTDRLAAQLQDCQETLARLDARVAQMELDLAAEGEAMAERLTAARMRHERLSAEVEELRDAAALRS